jgi:hypothetical protein
MKKNILLLLSCVAISCPVFALPINSYFQQGLIVDNQSQESILVTATDLPQMPELQNYLVKTKYTLNGKFPLDQFTNANGQAFGHTYVITSAIDNHLICNVTSHLVFGLTSMDLGKPISSDENKCRTTNDINFSNGNQIYSTEVTVLS